MSLTLVEKKTHGEN